MACGPESNPHADESFGQLVMAEQVRDKRALAALSSHRQVVEQHTDVVHEHVDLAAGGLEAAQQALRIRLQSEVAAFGLDALEARPERIIAQGSELGLAACHRSHARSGTRRLKHDVPADAPRTAGDEPVLAAVIRGELRPRQAAPAVPQLGEAGREPAVEADDFPELLIIHRSPSNMGGSRRNRCRWMLDSWTS